MLPSENDILKTTAAIFICAFSLSQSELVDSSDMWSLQEKSVLFGTEYILFLIKNQWDICSRRDTTEQMKMQVKHCSFYKGKPPTFPKRKVCL